jgi:dolichol kinase
MATSVRGEATRKSVHLLLSLVAAAVVWLLPPVEAATILSAATLLALAVEVARRISRPAKAFFDRRLGHLLRPGESGRLTGATTLALGYTTAVVAFPGVPALTGILVAGVADAVAAVVGKRFGRHRYPGGKSVEGSLGFLLVVLPLSLLLPGLPAVAAVLLAIGLTGLEALTLPVDDNLYLPLATAAAVQGAVLATGATFFS